MRTYRFEHNITNYKHNGQTNKGAVSFDILISQNIDDMGINNFDITEWQPGDKARVGEIITYEGNTYLTLKDTNGKWDEEKKRLLFDDKSFTLWSEYVEKKNPIITSENPNGIKFDFANGNIMNFYTDSKLKELRRFKTYVNSSDNIETPPDNEDWLYYYRIGVAHLSTINDENGNIVHFGDDMTNGKDLKAYGSGITNIEVNKEENTITFHYVIEQHLVCSGLTKVDNEDKYVCNDELVFDNNTDFGEGVKYSETYKIKKDSDLYKLITVGIDGFTFDTYTKDYETVSQRKFEFYNYNTIQNNTVEYGDTIIETNFVRTNGEINIDKNVDYNYNVAYKDDTYFGISYAPIVKDDVDIDRGNASVYEKLLKLSEIKTMDDLENYQNGGFYNIQKIN